MGLGETRAGAIFENRLFTVSIFWYIAQRRKESSVALANAKSHKETTVQHNLKEAGPTAIYETGVP